MAHNINFNSTTGRYSFFSVKEKAWHGLGQIVEQYPTSGEAIKHAGLDYEVAKRAHVKNMGRSLKFEKKNKWIFQYFLPFYLIIGKTKNAKIANRFHSKNTKRKLSNRELFYLV